MNSGICVGVLLAILSTSCLGRLSAGSDDEGSPVASELDQSLSVHQRQVRAATSNGQLKTAEGNMEQRANLGPLLARYLKQARKGSSGRNLALSSKSQTLDLNHRINDRDYMGWMDFGAAALKNMTPLKEDVKPTQKIENVLKFCTEKYKIIVIHCP